MSCAVHALPFPDEEGGIPSDWNNLASQKGRQTLGSEAGTEVDRSQLRGTAGRG